MRDHQWYEERLPFFINGRLPADEKEEIELHLQECPACREELALWQSVAAQVVGSNFNAELAPDLAKQALLQKRSRFSLRAILQHGLQLLKYQAPLVRQDMWPASAAMMVIGLAVTVLTSKINVLYFLAPMIAAATLALIYGPENDPATELTCTTSTSPALVLFARLTLVSAFNLALGTFASLIVAVLLPQFSFWVLMLTWMAPMAFLSMLALFLSMWMGAGNAVVIAYLLWVIQFIPFAHWKLFDTLPAWMQKVTLLQTFWQNDLVLWIGALGLMILSLACSRFSSLSRVAQQTA